MIRALLFVAALFASGCTPAFAQASAPPAVPAADWKAMLSAAKPGDVIDLGTREVQFARQVLAPAECCVTIKGGVFKGNVTLDNWRNVIIDGGRFDFSGGDGSYQIAILAYAPENLTLRNIEQVGTVLPDGQLAVSSLSVRGGRNVTVERSRFHDTSGFLQFVRTDGVVFQDNDLWNIREGVDLNGAQHVRFLRNKIGPFRASADDHADGLQVFTTNLTGATDKATQDLLVRGNIVISGATQPTRAQCFWNGDEIALYATPDRGYADFTFQGNICLGGGWHGISFPYPVKNLLVEGNQLYRLTGADTVKDVWISAQNGIVRNNMASRYILAAGVQQDGNATVAADITPADYAKVIADWDAKYRAPAIDPTPMPTPTPSPSPTPAPKPSADLSAKWLKAWTELHTATLALRRAESAMQALADQLGMPKP